MHYILGIKVLTREVCSRYLEEVQDDGLQGHGHTYGIEPEAIEWFFIRYGWCHDVSLDDLFLDVSNKYRTRHLIWCEHIETCSPNGCKACRGTVYYGLKYDANQKINLEGYVDSDRAGSSIDKKSTFGCCFSMGPGVISWLSRKQSYMALSTAKVEYVATFLASCEVVWLRKLLSNLFDL